MCQSYPAVHAAIKSHNPILKPCTWKSVLNHPTCNKLGTSRSKLKYVSTLNISPPFFKTSVSQPFFGSRHPTTFCRYMEAPLDGQIGININELYELAAPQTPPHGTRACRGTPVGNHCSRLNEMQTYFSTLN